MIETEERIKKFIGLYEADPCSGRRVRVLEFVAKVGGVRMVAVDDIVDIF